MRGLAKERGGVGYYPTSGLPFVHVDTGGVRHWPGISRTELALVFPNGHSRHVPDDGRPLTPPGFAHRAGEMASRRKRIALGCYA